MRIFPKEFRQVISYASGTLTLPAGLLSQRGHLVTLQSDDETPDEFEAIVRRYLGAISQALDNMPLGDVRQLVREIEDELDGARRPTNDNSKPDQA